MRAAAAGAEAAAEGAAGAGRPPAAAGAARSGATRDAMAEPPARRKPRSAEEDAPRAAAAGPGGRAGRGARRAPGAPGVRRSPDSTAPLRVPLASGSTATSTAACGPRWRKVSRPNRARLGRVRLLGSPCQDCATRSAIQPPACARGSFCAPRVRMVSAARRAGFHPSAPSSRRSRPEWRIRRRRAPARRR